MPNDQPEWEHLACQQQGDRIRQVRERANWTQEKLAEIAELGRSTIQRVEAGKGIKYTHLVRIARALDIPLSDFVQ